MPPHPRLRHARLRGLHRRRSEPPTSQQHPAGEAGISCASCHHIRRDVIPPGTKKTTPLEYFLEHSITGLFQFGPANELFGPFKVITSDDQVQIYEELTKDADGNLTTSFIRRDEEVKDNRLLPLGWTETGPHPSLNGESLHATFPKGDAEYRIEN